MNKYIDSEKLIAEIKRKIESIENCPFQLASLGEEKKSEGELIAYKDALFLIFSLQQEQQEVDLEKEFNDFLDNIEGVPRMWHSDEQIEWAKDIARHFAEWGAIYLSTRKEE